MGGILWRYDYYLKLGSNYGGWQWQIIGRPRLSEQPINYPNKLVCNIQSNPCCPSCMLQFTKCSSSNNSYFTLTSNYLSQDVGRRWTLHNRPVTSDIHKNVKFSANLCNLYHEASSQCRPPCYSPQPTSADIICESSPSSYLLSLFISFYSSQVFNVKLSFCHQ